MSSFLLSTVKRTTAVHGTGRRWPSTETDPTSRPRAAGRRGRRLRLARWGPAPRGRSPAGPPCSTDDVSQATGTMNVFNPNWNWRFSSPNRLGSLSDILFVKFIYFVGYINLCVCVRACVSAGGFPIVGREERRPKEFHYTLLLYFQSHLWSSSGHYCNN